MVIGIKRILKKVVFVSMFLMLVLLTGCGYSKEEKAAMKKYEKQGKKNAVNYIEEKYGFKADVEAISCDKINPGPVPDFWPSPTGDVKVTMEYKDKEFHVLISGKEKTTEGLDNYQMEEIVEAFAGEMEDVTGLHAEDAALCYGVFGTMNYGATGNGMVSTYYDGDNLEEVLEEGGDFSAVCSYIDEDVSDVGDALKDAFPQGLCLLVSYYSKADYESVEDHDFNLGGHPIDHSITRDAIFVKEYFYIDKGTETYTDFHVQEIEGIYFVTEEDAYIEVEETDIDDAEEWNGHGYSGARQIMDAYSLASDADTVYLFVPKEKVRVSGENPSGIALQYEHEGELKHKGALTFITDNDEYYTTALYMEDYEDLKFTVLKSTD